MGIKTDPGPLYDEASRRWPDPNRYGIEVIGTMPAPPEPEHTRQYLRQRLNEGLDALGVPDGSRPEPMPAVHGSSVTYTPPTLMDKLRLLMPRSQPARTPRGSVDVDWSGVRVRPAAKPLPEMPVSPRGQADRVQYAMTSEPLGGMDTTLLLDLGRHLGMDPLDVVQLGRNDPDLLARLSEQLYDMETRGYAPEAIASVLQTMIGQQQQQQQWQPINASLTRR